MEKRRPRWVYAAGGEPDPRFTLANERTFLAWVRTSLAMLAGAVALHSIGLPAQRWVRAGLVVVLVLVGTAMTALAWVRWARVERAMRQQTPLPAFTLGLAVTVAIMVVSALLLLALMI